MTETETKIILDALEVYELEIKMGFFPQSEEEILKRQVLLDEIEELRKKLSE